MTLRLSSAHHDEILDLQLGVVRAVGCVRVTPERAASEG
jgi:hypothetical protein